MGGKIYQLHFVVSPKTTAELVRIITDLLKDIPEKDFVRYYLTEGDGLEGIKK